MSQQWSLNHSVPAVFAADSVFAQAEWAEWAGSAELAIVAADVSTAALKRPASQVLLALPPIQRWAWGSPVLQRPKPTLQNQRLRSYFDIQYFEYTLSVGLCKEDSNVVLKLPDVCLLGCLSMGCMVHTFKLIKPDEACPSCPSNHYTSRGRQVLKKLHCLMCIIYIY